MEGRWLLLLHQIPPKPPYFRAQVLRRLSQVGALPVKNSAYLLPFGEEMLEDFQWIRREIVEQGGQAWLFRAEAIAGFAVEDIEAAFRELRANDYRALVAECEALLLQPDLSRVKAEHGKLARRMEEVRRIDFFGVPQRQTLEDLMGKIESRVAAAQETVDVPSTVQTGRTWVTRKGIKVDRIGSAWLIRRFIDSGAVFRFVDPDSYTLNPGETRFDMFEGEFTHQGDLCTFEVLVRANHLSDGALHAIAEIIHDLDLKEQRYDRPETAGVSRMLDGLFRETSNDEERLAQGARFFDRLYLSFAD